MENLKKVSVVYNKSLKQWEASNGNGFFFADKNKSNVLLHALKHDHPQIWGHIHGIACRCSDDGNGHGIPTKLVDRLINAAQLVAKGKVDLQQGLVWSQNGNGSNGDGNPEPYQVRFAAPQPGECKAWSCTCQDFTERGGFDAPGYGKHCKHTLAYMIAQFLGEDFSPYSLTPYAPAKSPADVGDFLQGMDDRHAKRLTDPAYLAALEEGGDAVFWYFYQEILTEFVQDLYWQAKDVLKIGECPATGVFGYKVDISKEITAEEIRSWTCSEFQFERIFEIPQLDGEQYGDFWLDFYEHSRNGSLTRLKGELITAFEQYL